MKSTQKRDIYVYVAGPLTQPNPAVNVRAAIDTANVLLRWGYIPFVPHLTHFWEMHYSHTWDEWLTFDEQWLSKCDVLLRMPGMSPGADREVTFARGRGIPVVYNTLELRERFPVYERAV